MATQKKTWERWSDEEVSAFWWFTQKASVEAAGSPSSMRLKYWPPFDLLCCKSLDMHILLNDIHGIKLVFLNVYLTAFAAVHLTSGWLATSSLATIINILHILFISNPSCKEAKLKSIEFKVRIVAVLVRRLEYYCGFRRMLMGSNVYISTCTCTAACTLTYCPFCWFNPLALVHCISKVHFLPWVAKMEAQSSTDFTARHSNKPASVISIDMGGANKGCLYMWDSAGVYIGYTSSADV